MSVALDRPFLADRLAELIAARNANPRGIVGVIEDGERQAGHVLVPLGATTPFAVPIADWHCAVISLCANKARIVLVDAKHQNTGALRRLVSAILAANMVPVIVEPVGPVMPLIVRRWHWKRRIRGHGWEQSEEWSPRRLDRLHSNGRTG